MTYTAMARIKESTTYLENIKVKNKLIILTKVDILPIHSQSCLNLHLEGSLLILVLE